MNKLTEAGIPHFQAMSNKQLVLECPGANEDDSGKLMARLRGGQSCPTDFLSHSYTPYRIQNFTYTSGKVIESIVVDHFGGFSKAMADHLERFYHTRIYGRSRWERWERGNQSEEWWLTRAEGLRHRCNGDLYDEDLGMTRVDCRDWTWTTFNPHDGYEPRAWLIQHSVGWGNQLVNHDFGLGSAQFAGGDYLDALRTCLVRNSWRSVNAAQSMTAGDLRNTVIISLANAGFADVPHLQGMTNAALAAMCPNVGESYFAGVKTDLAPWQAMALDVFLHTDHVPETFLSNNHYVCLTQQHGTELQFYQDVLTSILPVGTTQLGFGLRAWAPLVTGIGTADSSGWQFGLKQFDENGAEIAQEFVLLNPTHARQRQAEGEDTLLPSAHRLRVSLEKEASAPSTTAVICVDDAWLTPV